MKEEKSAAILKKDFFRIKKRENELFSVGLYKDNIYIWDILIFGPNDTLYENGIFPARMIFTKEYPNYPPAFKFLCRMWHPNIDENGNVCISILHPGDDEFGYEATNERWMPVRDPESVIISIISLLSSPNVESPANVEAAQQLRKNKVIYEERVKEYVRKYCQ
ncbi:ubiquitin conjugating enzyme E2 [Tubulinosema ratisbonensis]|uniref:Ubiquitin conjugating enzyme E2 n=1 Tax=Tubulinosema ratisbonensis TaxID=291195 RepID=A0A437AN22_9MICR|nr:ubiquitin conjugating enzyme E2 [Tubulinosema ratisbonensis]